MTLVSNETQERIAVLRQRARDNTISPEDMKEAIALMRGDRVRAAKTSAKARTPKAAKAPVDSDALLDALGGF